MSSQNQCPVTPSVLAWARETSGYEEAIVADKFSAKKVTPNTIRQWESGESQPTYSQLEKLANLYKRPIALFFFPAPPEEEPIENDLRALPQHIAQDTPPHIRYLVRKAKARQIGLSELHSGNPIQTPITASHATASESPKSLAARIRKRVGISIDEQRKWGDAATAFKRWRAALEGLGVWVFKEAFNDDAYCGFCVYDEAFPVIYVNNSQPDQRQIFTLFHELGHLLTGKAGVDFRNTTDWSGSYQAEEVFCNSFAGNFLVPDDELKDYAHLPDDADIENLAKTYNVSFEVILRKFLDKKLISDENYKRSIRGRKFFRGGGSGGDYYNTQQAYLGHKYMGLVFEQYYQNRITQRQLADYLDIKAKSIAGLEDVFHRYYPI